MSGRSLSPAPGGKGRVSGIPSALTGVSATSTEMPLTPTVSRREREKTP